MDTNKPRDKSEEWPNDWHPETDADDIAEARERDRRRRQRRPKPVKKQKRRNWFNLCYRFVLIA